MEPEKPNEKLTELFKAKVIDRVTTPTQYDEGCIIYFTDGTNVMFSWSGCEGAAHYNGDLII